MAYNLREALPVKNYRSHGPCGLVYAPANIEESMVVVPKQRRQKKNNLNGYMTQDSGKNMVASQIYRRKFSQEETVRKLQRKTKLFKFSVENQLSLSRKPR